MYPSIIPQRKKCQRIELSFCHFVTPRFLSDRFILYTIILCISFRFWGKVDQLTSWQGDKVPYGTEALRSPLFSCQLVNFLSTSNELNDNSSYISSVSNYIYKKNVNIFLFRSYPSDSLSESDSVRDWIPFTHWLNAFQSLTHCTPIQKVSERGWKK